MSRLAEKKFDYLLNFFPYQKEPRLLLKSFINFHSSYYYSIQSALMQAPTTYVCLIGNDGCGKSTLCRELNSHPLTPPNTKFIERSMTLSNPDAHTLKLIKEIKHLDLLTYSYSFEDDWYKFSPSRELEDGSKVFWVLLRAEYDTTWKRIGSRTEMTIYEHPKCLKYFNYVYMELAYFYGFPVIHTEQSKEVSVEQVQQIIASSITLPSIKDLTKKEIFSHDVEDNLAKILTPEAAEQIYRHGVLPELVESGMKQLYFEEGMEDQADERIRILLAARWLRVHGQRKWDKNVVTFSTQKLPTAVSISVPLTEAYFLTRKIEGQSKILYELQSNEPILQRHFHNKVLIILKGTIYSHTKQCTTQMDELPAIRATGSMLFLEMLKRNNLNHSYVSVNRQAVILSNFVQTNDLEIVFKKENLGTDKHSFHGLSGKPEICGESGVYQGGIYVRFDWRNPNHQYEPHPNKVINLDPYYYVLEKHMGKEEFFTKVLSRPGCKPIGDKCITPDLIGSYVNTEKVRELTVEAYCCFQYYAGEVGLEILDGCMMVDVECKTIWSEINPDCLRVKAIQDRTDYDKDIWRAGGSSSKNKIIEKWGIFNQMFIKYFQEHRFMKEQMKREEFSKQVYAQKLLHELAGRVRPGYEYIYRNIARGNRQRRVIGTIDLIQGEPILVESSVFKEKHSGGSLMDAWNHIRILPQVVIVDIDGASGKDNSLNLQSIKNTLFRQPFNNIYAVGGGIRDNNRADQYLQRYPHIIISSNLDLINQTQQKDRHRIIVELSINQANEILTHARTVNTKQNIVEKMKEICDLGIKTISITFNNSEGRLAGIPREQLRKIMYEVPGGITTVIIAGGITSMDDLEFLWGFEKCVPQLGSAIWKGKIKLGEIYKALVSYDKNGLVPAVIRTSPNGHVAGLVYLNSQAIEKTCEERVLWRYSRKHGRLIKKGEQSGNIQKVIGMSIDCDNDSLLITVSEENPTFCHLDTKSCFNQDTVQSHSKSLDGIQVHINESKGGYAEKVQRNPNFAINKIVEEAEELGLAESHERRVDECADLYAHLLMFMNSQGISQQEITSQLARRSRVKKIPKEKPQTEEGGKMIKIGLGLGKHTSFIYQFLENSLGFRITNPSEKKKRCYHISYEVVNREKFDFNFPNLKGRELVFMSVKPKDMGRLVQKGYIDYGVNYSNVVASYVSEQMVVYKSEPIPNLKLGLIKRKGRHVDKSSWSRENKGVIISEYPAEVTAYLSKEGIPSDYYKLIKVSGHSQSYLSDPEFDLCDAIIYTGKTLEDNNLEAEAILEPAICAVLFRTNQA